jgi:hypothetical protein
MNPTRVPVLLLIAALGAVAGWAAVQVMDNATGRALPVPWLAAATLWLLALALSIWALSCRSRLPHRAGGPHRVGGPNPVSGRGAAVAPARPPMHPIVAARTAALAMAASRVGAAIGGLYGGIAIGVAARTSEAARSVLWTALAACVACAVIVSVAVWLEMMCRLPRDPDSSRPPGGPRLPT